MFASRAVRISRRASSWASPRRTRRALSSLGLSSTSDARANMKVFVIVYALCTWMAGAPQTGYFEKQAITLAQEMPASDLDDALPGRSFASWISEIIGPKAGVVWQLTECGEQVNAPGEPGQDLPACAEINANLEDGRKVF